jgi:hypothetical protein
MASRKVPRGHGRFCGVAERSTPTLKVPRRDGTICGLDSEKTPSSILPRCAGEDATSRFASEEVAVEHGRLPGEQVRSEVYVIRRRRIFDLGDLLVERLPGGQELQHGRSNRLDNQAVSLLVENGFFAG